MVTNDKKVAVYLGYLYAYVVIKSRIKILQNFAIVSISDLPSSNI